MTDRSKRNITPDNGEMKPVIRRLVEKVAMEIDPDVEVRKIKIGDAP